VVFIQAFQITQPSLKDAEFLSASSSLGANFLTLCRKTIDLLVFQVVDQLGGKQSRQFADEATFDCKNTYVINKLLFGNLLN
jgi:hypothetical protein